jgi:hypothetical protein
MVSLKRARRTRRRPVAEQANGAEPTRALERLGAVLADDTRPAGPAGQTAAQAAVCQTSAWPERMEGVGKRARRVSDLLGEDHDLAVLTERIQEAPLGRDDVKLLRRLIGRRREKLQAEAHRVARRLYRRKPGKFVRRLGLA